MAEGKATIRHGRVPLTAAEILELGGCLTDVFRMLREMRDRNKVAAYIKYPPLPPVFSESIVIAAAPTLFGAGYTARFGGKLCDVVLTRGDGGDKKRVEVKATGRHAFQELKEKDLRADILVWIRFGDYFEVGSGVIEAAVLENPGEYVRSPRRLDVKRFDAIVGVVGAQRLFSFDSLKSFVAGNSSSSPKVSADHVGSSERCS